METFGSEAGGSESQLPVGSCGSREEMTVKAEYSFGGYGCDVADQAAGPPTPIAGKVKTTMDSPGTDFDMEESEGFDDCGPPPSPEIHGWADCEPLPSQGLDPSTLSLDHIPEAEAAETQLSQGSKRKRDWDKFKKAAISTFDVTIQVTDETSDHCVVGKALAGLATKFVFQKESAARTGRLHYQVRLRVRQRQYLGNFIKANSAALFGGHITATSNAAYEARNFNYVMKADTRVEGPWKDEDFNLDEQPVMTRQLTSFLRFELRPWQVQLETMVKECDDRRIIFIHDRVGNVGKSIYCEYLEYKALAYEIPPFNRMEDVMNVVQAVRRKNCFIVDMPRSLPKGALAEFYAGLECVKNGVAFDKRHHWKKTRFDRPQVVVFSNRMPMFRFLSMDRWLIFNMLKTFELQPLTIPEARR